MADYTYLKVEKDEGIAVCTLYNPPLNLMNAPMVGELLRLAGEMDEDPEVRVLILTGGVDGIFITHYDVEELSQASRALEQAPMYSPGELHAAHQAFNRLQSMSKPVIAALNGTAMGGGCELALACDFRFMARVGVIGLPEVRVGILPGAGGTQRLNCLLGAARALEMMLLGKLITADEAEAIGLVHRALDPGELVPYTREFAQALAQRPALSLALIKRCVHEGGGLPLLEGLKLEQECFWETMRSEDARRLMQDYLEGRLAPLTDM